MSKTENIVIQKDNFWAIHSIYKALTIRGFELILLSILTSASYFNFKEENFLFVLTKGQFLYVLAINILIITSTSFVLYKLYESIVKKIWQKIQSNKELFMHIFPTLVIKKLKEN